jgi:hypothetical protein
LDSLLDIILFEDATGVMLSDDLGGLFGWYLYVSRVLLDIILSVDEMGVMSVKLVE